MPPDWTGPGRARYLAPSSIVPVTWENSRIAGISSCLGRCLVVTVTGPFMLLTRAEAAEVAGVSVERIRTWERRGHLECAGLNEAGQRVYEAVEVAKVLHKLDGFTRVSAAA